MSYPKQLIARRKIEALTGIKSSLDKIRSVIALVYLLYVANERKASVRYSIPEGSRIKIAPNLLNAIEGVLGRNNLGGTINGNPLITNQYEPLYVGVTLLMKLGYLKMEGRQNTAERTGGVRYPKQLYFANNTLVLDLILQGFPDNIWKQSLYEWLQNNKASNNEFEERVCKFITTCTFLTQFKLRDNSNNELFFQTEGIYKALTESDEDVLYSDSHEFVGPTRIYNNVLKEGLEPWIGINKNVLNLKGNLNPDAESISQMLSTTLDIFSVKDDSSMSEDDIEDNYEEAMLGKRNNDYPLQQIFYGAPGTGKSNTIKSEVDQKDLPRVRTTFHPDSDYSTFVGAYKPTSVEVPEMTKIGTKAVPVENPDGTPRKEKKIVYEFVPQAFLKAYTGAWKNQDEPFFLIIEEINRGNCAQIFGDLFQLLDRNDEGESDYPISPDEDIQKFLLTDKKYGFAELTEEQKETIPEEIKLGQLLKLPKNLHIWATMNTSDQSLFPIDSAFKRRWDWQYMPISDGKKDWKIEVNGKRYDWWLFLVKINEKISDTTNSEDKKLGYYFCKAKNGKIDVETFVGKVIFYLWNDVFKDFAEEAGDLFQDEDGLLTFNKFYMVDTDGKTRVVEDKVEFFLKNLGVEEDEVIEYMQDDEAEAMPTDRATDASNRLHVVFSDGETIRIQTGKEYVDVLKKIGLDKAYEIAKSKNPGILKCAFVTKEKEDAIENSSYLRYETIGEYHVVRGMSGDTMRPFLEKISNRYNLGLKFYRQ